MNIHKASGSTFVSMSGGGATVAAGGEGNEITALGWPHALQNFAESLIS